MRVMNWLMAGKGAMDLSLCRCLYFYVSVSVSVSVQAVSVSVFVSVQAGMVVGASEENGFRQFLEVNVFIISDGVIFLFVTLTSKHLLKLSLAG